MARESDILQAILDRLRSELQLGERTAFLALSHSEPPKVPRAGDWVLTVTPGRSQYPLEEQAFGQQLVEELVITVTIYTRIALDPVDHAEALILDATRGLAEAKRRVARALAGRMLFSGPTPLVRDALELRFASEIHYAPEAHIAWQELDFAVRFDWD
jgi:hypothetical protein